MTIYHHFYLVTIISLIPYLNIYHQFQRQILFNILIAIKSHFSDSATEFLLDSLVSIVLILPSIYIVLFPIYLLLLDTDLILIP